MRSLSSISFPGQEVETYNASTTVHIDFVSSMSASLRILLVGSGGREHALAWRLSQSSLVKHIFVAPGNGGTQFGEKCSNADIAAGDLLKLVKFAEDNEVGFVTSPLLVSALLMSFLGQFGRSRP